MDDVGTDAGAMITEADPDDPSGQPRPSGDQRGPVGPWSVPEADTFRFEEVDQSGGGDDGPPGRRGMTFVFDERGIAISGPERRRHAFVPWSDVVGVTFGAAVVGPDGEVETPFQLASSAGPAGYVVRSAHPLPVVIAALESQAARWAGLSTPPETVRPAVVPDWAPPPPRSPTTGCPATGAGRPGGLAATPRAGPA